MKKSVLLILGLLVSSVVLSAFASAITGEAGSAGGLITTISEDIVQPLYDSGIKPLAEFLIGKQTAADSENFFTLILMMVLLVSILWEITERVPMIGNNNWVQFIVSFAIALISIRFLGASSNAGWFQTVLLPNQALGITLLCIIPFIIYFFFVMDVGVKSPTLAKIMWVFASVIFAMLYLTRVDEIGALSTGKFNPANVYLIVAVVSFAFLWFDNTLRKWYSKIKSEKLIYEGYGQSRIAINKQLADLKVIYSSDPVNYKSQFGLMPSKKGHEVYKKDLEKLHKELAAMT